MAASQVARTPLRRDLPGAALTGLLFALAAPPLGCWPLAGICLVPMLRALRGRGPASRAWLGWLAGSLAALFTIAWPLGSAFSRFFAIPFWQAGLGALVVGMIFGGGGFAIFGLLAGDPLRQGPALGILRAGAAWVAADLFRTTALTGLPWLLLGQLLAPAPELAQLATVGGTGLLSFWVACVNATALAAALPEARRTAALLMVGLGATGWVAARTTPAAGVEAPGAVRVAPAEGRVPAGALRVALVQPAIPNAWRKNAARVGDSIARLTELTRRAGRVDLVVWPENAIHVVLPANRQLVVRALAGLDAAPEGLLLGAPRFDEQDPARIYTAAQLFDPAGTLVASHDKVHLVPFTEYLPWPLSRLGLEGPGTSPGSRPTPLPVGDGSVGPLICYEMLFPDLAHRLVEDGADVLVNISNDGWFGGSGGAEQHLTAAVLRAIEFRRPVLRSTSDGITVAIDSAGRIVGRLAEREAGVLVVDVWPNPARTLYARTGDVLAWMALLVAGALTGMEIARTRRPPTGGERRS